METIYLPSKATFNYRKGSMNKAIRTVIIEAPDKVKGLASYWYDMEFQLLCTLIGVTWEQFLEMGVMKFAECLEA